MRWSAAFLLVSLVTLVVSCGRKGPLELPEESISLGLHSANARLVMHSADAAPTNRELRRTIAQQRFPFSKHVLG